MISYEVLTEPREGQNKMMQMVEKGLRNPAPDLNHTWPQPPMKFEDLFGNVMPIPAEFNWDVSFSQSATYNLKTKLAF